MVPAIRLLQKYCNGTRHDFAVVFEKFDENPIPPIGLKIASAFKSLTPTRTSEGSSSMRARRCRWSQSWQNAPG